MGLRTIDVKSDPHLGEHLRKIDRVLSTVIAVTPARLVNINGLVCFKRKFSK
jgi:hypothetical protein